jgi:hypothetical protein
LLEAAERAGMDLWGLELQRRRMNRDMAAYDAHVRVFGEGTTQARRLRTSIAGSVAVIATAIKRMVALVADRAAVEGRPPR